MVCTYLLEVIKTDLCFRKFQKLNKIPIQFIKYYGVKLLKNVFINLINNYYLLDYLHIFLYIYI